jgi:hypothetical protein
MSVTTKWPSAELRRIVDTDDLHVSPLREDGVTYGTPSWIWSVVVDGDLYVRGYNGTRSRWYQAALRQEAGRITAAGMTREVTFEPVDGAINDRIDDAYRAKYAGSPYLAPMIGARGGAGVVISSQSGHRLPPLTVGQNRALAATPVEELLGLPFLQPDQVTDSLHAYQPHRIANKKLVRA